MRHRFEQDALRTTFIQVVSKAFAGLVHQWHGSSMAQHLTNLHTTADWYCSTNGSHDWVGYTQKKDTPL
jgi:hypothetical protein